MSDLKELITLDLDQAGFPGMDRTDLVIAMQDFRFSSDQTKSALTEMVLKDKTVLCVPSGRYKLLTYVPWMADIENSDFNPGLNRRSGGLLSYLRPDFKMPEDWRDLPETDGVPKNQI